MTHFQTKYLDCLSIKKKIKKIKTLYCNCSLSSFCRYCLRLYKHETIHYCLLGQAGDILKRIKADFRAKIPDLDWMDEVTKQRAIEKVDAVQDKIGFPDMAQDPPMLDAYYEKVGYGTYHWRCEGRKGNLPVIYLAGIKESFMKQTRGIANL